MSNGSNQKLKLSILCKIMQEKIDDEHSLTLAQIIKELQAYDITAERKSLYDDFKCMEDYLGIEVIKEQIGRETFYHVGSRAFELAEVKLLISERYGEGIISELADELTQKYGKGFDKRSLYRYVQFYQSYPEIVGIMTPKSDDIEHSGIVGMTTPQSGEHAMIVKGRKILTWSHYER